MTLTVYDEISKTEKKFHDVEKAELYAFSLKLGYRDQGIPTVIERDIAAIYVW